MTSGAVQHDTPIHQQNSRLNTADDPHDVLYLRPRLHRLVLHHGCRGPVRH